MSNLNIIRGRQVVLPLTNASGAQRTAGDVVIVYTDASSFTTTTTADLATAVIGVVQETIAIAAIGRVLTTGYAAAVKVTGATSIRDFLYTSTTGAQADPDSTRKRGAFGQALTAIGVAGTVEAILFGVPDVTGNRRGVSLYVDGVLVVETQAASAIIPVGLSLTVASVSIAVDVAPTGATLIVDINKNGTTIFTTQANRPTIAISGTSATSAAPDVTGLTGGDKVGVDIDQVGSTVAGENLAVVLNCTEV